MIQRLLIANRGEIARRVIRTARRLGIATVAVYSSADTSAQHVREADEAIPLGPPAPRESYLVIDKLIAAARRSGADAVHPGYGFLSERADFATAVSEAGLTWVGPPPAAIAAVGDKLRARALMAEAGVPVIPGSGDVAVPNADAAARMAGAIGYPVMVKAAAGGGGIGMRIARDEPSLRSSFQATSQQAQRFFGSGDVLIERYLDGARHVEIQILGLPDGRIVALGERECSVQRRYQKVFEETPSCALNPELRQRMSAAAVQAGQSIGYRNAGTVECLVAGDRFVFLEINARLQVEHPVTELVRGIDLVAAQLRIAAGEEPGFDPEATQTRGHAVELRVYAEDPVRFLPSPGRITTWDEPDGPGIRVDSGYTAGDEVTPFYDPLLAKLCAWGPDRDNALDRAADAVARFRIDGPRTNLPFLARLLGDAELRAGEYDVGLVERMQASQP